MTPDALAALHARAFTVPAPWSAADFADLLAEATVRLLTAPHGFLLLRSAAGEAEILTLAVDPDHRRQGIARSLVTRAAEAARHSGAQRIFLEVSAENPGALTLYEAAGFLKAGLRPAYYRAPGGRRVDALLLAREI